MDSDRKDAESQIVGSKRSTLFTVCPFILGNEFCERLAFYGLATNMVTYITKVMNGGSAYAAVQLSMFEGTCYLTPLLGAWLADSMLGRYKTILLASGVYLVGMVTLALSSAVPPFKPDPDTETTPLQNIALYTSLYIVAIGTGGIKPNVSAFGADQFDEFDPQDRKEKASFFNWFYFSINIGSLIAATAVVWVQDNISWTVGFLIPAVAMCLAVVSFVAGSPLYKHMPPTESPVARVVKVVSAAVANSWKRWRQVEAPEAEWLLPPSAEGSAHGGNAYVGATDLSTLAARTPPLTASRSYAWLDAAITQDRSSGSGGMLMGATAAGFTRKQVEEVKMVLRLLPIFFTTIAYWAIYMQMGTFFVQQGNIMDNEVRLGSWQFAVPSASMSSFNTISIIILIPLWDGWLEPWLTRARGGRKMTLLQKIGWGMVITIGAMLAAAAVEYQRLAIFWAGHERSGVGQATARGSDPERVALNILWQAPQYFLVGASEVLASVGQLEFFYDQAPDVMRSCCMAMQLLSTALGSYLAGALVLAAKSITASIDQDWLPRNLNYGHLDLFFLALAGMMAVNLVAFIWVSMSYEYKAVTHIRPSDLAPVTEAAEPPSVPDGAAGPATARTTAPLVIGRGPRPPLEPQDDPYGRSLAFQPYSPALPAPFR